MRGFVSYLLEGIAFLSFVLLIFLIIPERWIRRTMFDNSKRDSK